MILKKKLLKNSIPLKKMFSTTSFKRIEGETTLILMEHAGTSPVFTLVIVFASFTLTVGAYVLTHLTTSASDAQHYQMFPEEVADHMYGFFFVPDHLMGHFIRFLIKVTDALDYWDNIDHLRNLSNTEAREFSIFLLKIEKMFKSIRTQCEYIVELDDTIVNANLEHLTQDINTMNIFLAKINNMQDLLIQIFSSMA